MSETWADAILVAHFGVVAFVVVGQLLFMLGGWRRWSWTRARWLRLTHVALIGCVAAQAWLGLECPLTTWERDLRAAAGGATHDESFIEHWLARLIFFEAPAWAFVAAYTAFAALVAATWWRHPPEPRRRRTPHHGDTTPP